MHGSRRGRREVARFPRCFTSLTQACCHDAEPSKSQQGWLNNLSHLPQPCNLNHKCPSHVSTGYLRAVSLWITLKLSNFAHCILQPNDRSILKVLLTLLSSLSCCKSNVFDVYCSLQTFIFGKSAD